MSLATDLLEQAQHLTTRESRRPRQASLRRALSAAYYALFHLLVEDASRRVTQGDLPTQALTARVYDHSEMRKASRAFQSGIGAFPLSIREVLGASFVVQTDLRLVAETFADLQQFRHDADYNTVKRYSRENAQRVVARAEAAFDAWRRVRATPEARVYLLSLLLWSRWTR